MGKGMEKIDLYSKASNASSTIIVYGAQNGSPSIESSQLDEIDANAHETFTLEEMRSLIIAYRKKDKDFLLARVTTPDPENQNIFYNFYYSAAEINRILFRFESNRRLLHRMKVKNPLNNMYIVGQVFYYKISTYDIDKAIVDYYFNNKKESRKVRNAFSAVFRHNKESFTEDSKIKKSKDCLDIRSKSSRNGIEEKNPREIIESISKGKTTLPKDIPDNKKIKYEAKYFASDDDFLIKSEIRDYFRKNALEAEDDFLYEIDRTQNDFMALLEDDSNDAEDISDWRRIFSAHVSLALSMLFVCLLLGGGPGIAIIFLPIAVLIFLSFLCSLFYVLFCRRSSFDSMAVNSVEEEL